jgi:hypothetical protein
VRRGRPSSRRHSSKHLTFEHPLTARELVEALAQDHITPRLLLGLTGFVADHNRTLLHPDGDAPDEDDEDTPAAPPMPDPCAHRQTLRLEETLQMARGDVMGGGDRLRRQGWVGETRVDEGPDVQEQRLLGGVRAGGLPAEPSGEDGGEQVGRVAGKHLADLGAVCAGLAKAAADPVGHYFRPDVTRLQLNRTARRPVEYTAPRVETFADQSPVDPEAAQV